MRRRDWPRRLGQGLLVGLAVAILTGAAQAVGLLETWQLASSNYLYGAGEGPGDEIVILAIDEESLARLGPWPWPYSTYVELLNRLEGTRAIGIDVLFTEEDITGEGVVALADTTYRLGNVVYPVTTLSLHSPTGKGGSYRAGRIVQTLPELRQAAAGVGAVSVIIDKDGAIRRAPLIVQMGGEQREAFSLQLLRLALSLPPQPLRWSGGRLVIGDQLSTAVDDHGAVLINYVGPPGTFPTYSVADVIEGRIDPARLEDKIALVGWMNVLQEYDLHNTPISAGQRMAGVEIQANIIHTLLHYKSLVPQSLSSTMVTILILALISGLGLSWLSGLRLGVILGLVFSAALGLAYFLFTGFAFQSGTLPGTLYPFATIILCYGGVIAVGFFAEQSERRRVMQAFGRHVSPRVRDEIMDNPELIELGGEQREISVLFADIRGFTAMSEKLEPSQVVGILNQYLDGMTRVVFKHGGTLDKFTGDGMMVFFNAPSLQDDHAQRAVQAAVEMQEQARQTSKARGDSEWAVEYGIGITTGEAVVGNIGSADRHDYTAIGDTVNLAARLEGQAGRGQILISERTYQQARDIIEARPMEPIKVKGKKEPVTVYEVLGLRS
ncbi:MAG TPA: adenylate/guanylate cyclase domain-containing protein [Anaerolineae bacterium]|nr:adenylate/guanylate cyclase domain-containing protein [Anaerolineae bacterium]